MAKPNGSPDAERRDPNTKRTKASHETVQPHLSNEGRWDKHPAPLFHTTLTDWGLRPNLHTDIYDYYNRLDQTSKEGPGEGLESKSNDLHEVLQEDALAREDGDTVATRWVKKGEIARGAFGKVYLWEKPGFEAEPPLRMVVKDSQTSNFWHDYHAEGELIRQLNGRGCQNVVTVLDWLYKPASASHKAFVRTCYEHAEHGDLGDIGLFYRTRQLLLPEAFLWHVFRSVANALCYCRHGSNETNQPRPDWDTIVHGDVKPSNMLLIPPDDSVDSLYPTVKLCDFGTSFTMPESIPKLRAWKSTFQYGTSGFWAPEVETAKPLENVPGKFRPVAAHRIHGSHSDVYSLGAVLDQLMDLRFNALKDHPDFDNPHVIDYYSPELRALVKACRRTQIYARPAIWDVYRQTSEAVVRWRDAAHAEAKSVRTGRPYQSQVLFSKADRARFDNDPGFRHSYRRSNRAPLLTGKKTTPEPAQTQCESASSITRNRLLSDRPTESPDKKKVKIPAHAGNSTSIDRPKTAPAPSPHPSAFVLPGFAAPGHRKSPPFTTSTLRSPPPPSPALIFGSLDSQVRAAWEAGNLTSATRSLNSSPLGTKPSPVSAFGARLANQKSPFSTQARRSPPFTVNDDEVPSILASPPLLSSTRQTPSPSSFNHCAVTPGAPPPSTLTPSPFILATTGKPVYPTPQPPPIPTATKPIISSSSTTITTNKNNNNTTISTIPTTTKNTNNKRPLEEHEDDADVNEPSNEEEQQQQQQPKRKISRFIEDLPEAPPRPARRTLR
ncbi:MAG: hypothetical protein LQ346_004479 [Caloplaca aetnensis]|nr:MAG: hypothetical protein LQ346_004479 [Caloplaca aetnensis]